MNLTPVFHMGLLNAWLLCIPLLIAFAIGALNKELAKRMSDMTGNDTREKFFTVAASLAPYPFMIATVWTPFTPIKTLLYGGLAVYSIGVASFIATLHVIAKTPLDKPFSDGVYRVSRNPLYVSATLIFFGICLVTVNLVLFANLVILVMLQHFMILAEEGVCREKYGVAFERYMEKVPRYLLL